MLSFLGFVAVVPFTDSASAAVTAAAVVVVVVENRTLLISTGIRFKKFH